jgi:septal ring factor EnvC (AmiA/AmiB activator)
MNKWYTEEGEEVFDVEKTDRGMYIGRVKIVENDSYGDLQEHLTDYLVFYDLYESLPTHIYDEQITKLQNDIKSLKGRHKQLLEETRSLRAEWKELKENVRIGRRVRDYKNEIFILNKQIEEQARRITAYEQSTKDNVELTKG